MENNRTLIFCIAVILVGAALIWNSTYVVREGYAGFLTFLGEIQMKKNGQPLVFKPGLHFKYPFLESALILDTRLQTLTIDKSRVMTLQKKDVLVDYYVKWRIDHLATYFTSTGGNAEQAEQLLAQQVNNALRAEFGKRDIQDVVSDARSEIMLTLQKSANISAQLLGIEVVDVRIKAIDLPDEVSSAVFNRMQAERERIATERRSEGQASAEAIKAKADSESAVILAKAREQAAKLMAQGDRDAAQIYSEAYNKEPNFYVFYKSLETYRKSFSKLSDGIILTTQNEWLKYFSSPHSLSLGSTEKK